MVKTDTQTGGKTLPLDTPQKQDAARLADLFGQLMTKTLSLRLLDEMPTAREMELTLPQMHALHHLWRHEKVRIGELAAGLEISFPSATNMVKRLADKGLVARIVNPGDRREVEVVLTDRGCALAESFEAERLHRFTALLERMEAGERDAFIAGLYRFVRLAVGEDVCTADEICLRCGRRASADCPLAEAIPLFVCR